MISAIIINLNQLNELEECLKSIRDFADEIILIDLKSNDRSIELAKKYGAKIYSHQRVEYVELVRNYSVSKASNEWVLILDPDEKLGEELKKRLKDIAGENKYQAVNIPRKNIFFDRWIKHTNWWPDKHIRFFKKNTITWEEKIHSYPKVKGKIYQLPVSENLAIIHKGYESFSEFIKRQNRYSSIDAQNRFDIGIRFSWINFVWWPMREFLVRFIKHLGFLDGLLGFYLVFLMMVYQMIVVVKMWEIEHIHKTTKL